MSLAIHIRNETPADAQAITDLTIAAFATLELSSHTEQGDRGQGDRGQVLSFASLIVPR